VGDVSDIDGLPGGSKEDAGWSTCGLKGTSDGGSEGGGKEVSAMHESRGGEVAANGKCRREV
jgi:hypothetical protein